MPGSGVSLEVSSNRMLRGRARLRISTAMAHAAERWRVAEKSISGDFCRQWQVVGNMQAEHFSVYVSMTVSI